MRRFYKLFNIIVIIVAAIFIFIPPLIGMGIQKYASELLLFNNSKAEIIHYHRGWFSSDVTIRVTTKNSSVKQLLKTLSHSQQKMVEPFEFLIQEHVVHGSLFYSLVKLALQKNHEDLWIGVHEFLFSEIIIKDSGNMEIKITNLQWQSSVSETTGWITSDQRFSIAKIILDNNINKYVLGPILLKMHVNKLDAQTISNLINTCQSMSWRNLNIMTLLPQLIMPGSSIELKKLSFTAPLGQLQMRVKLQWPSTLVSNAGNLIELLHTMHMQTFARISGSLLDQFIRVAGRRMDLSQQKIHADLENYIQDNYIVRDKNDYVMSMLREDGVVTLNGKEMPD